MLVLLPEDGTAVLNRVMRVMLSQALADSIDEDRYLRARELLRREGHLALKGGQGGQIFRTLQRRANAPVESNVSGVWPEAKLMPWLKKYLDEPFRETSNFLKGAKYKVYDTSTVGKPGIRWARPDFTLVSIKQFSFLPGIELDVHSFELKTEVGATDLAVYEALAQTRFTHFGHLVWHLPAKSKAEQRLAGIQKQCDQHGIGLIRIREPKNPDTWEILTEPIRKTTLASEVDEFLRERLNDSQRREVLALINGTRQ